MERLVYNASVFRCSVVYVIEKRWNLKEIAKWELKNMLIPRFLKWEISKILPLSKNYLKWRSFLGRKDSLEDEIMCSLLEILSLRCPETCLVCM